MNRSLKTTGLVALLLASVALAIIAVNLRSKQTIIVPTSQEVAVVATTNDSPLPTPPPPDQPLAPDCELVVKPIQPAEKSAAAVQYELEPPKVIASGVTGFILVGWLPDSQRLLYTQGEANSNDEGIFTLNIETGEVRSYGTRTYVNAQPVWVEAQQAVVYTEQTDNKRYRLLMSKGEGEVTEMIADLPTPHIAAGDGQTVLFSDGKQGELPSSYSIDQKSLRPWQFSLSLEKRQDGREQVMNQVFPYQIATQPATNQGAFYGNNGLYVADLTQQTACYLGLDKEKDFDGFPIWPYFVKWSPDGSQLAMLTTSDNYAPSLSYSEVTLLNIQTGEMHSIRPETTLKFGQNAGGYGVTGISWAPDSQFVIVTAIVRDDEQGFAYDGLFKVGDKGSLIRLLPDYEFGGESSIVEWSPDGQSIAINCPTIKEGRLCLVKVNHK